jgi:hypothetical protein
MKLSSGQSLARSGISNLKLDSAYLYRLGAGFMGLVVRRNRTLVWWFVVDHKIKLARFVYPFSTVSSANEAIKKVLGLMMNNIRSNYLWQTITNNNIRWCEVPASETKQQRIVADEQCERNIIITN